MADLWKSGVSSRKGTLVVSLSLHTVGVETGTAWCTGPMIVSWWNLFYPGAMDQYSPANRAPDIRMPVMIIHGEE
jgi:hypothetical protein